MRMGWILFGALLIAQLVLIELGFSVFSKIGDRLRRFTAERFKDEVPLEQEFALQPIRVETRDTRR
jgi:hypothetical protein